MDLNGITRRQLFLCFDMLENLIEETPDSIWNEKKGGFIFWQQILHTLTSTLYWFRTKSEGFSEPFKELNVFPELDKDPENQLTKQQVFQVFKEAKVQAASFFDKYNAEQLLKDSVLVHDITGLDVVLMQIRHLQYHIGHCEGLLRDSGKDVPEWLDIV